MRSQALLAEVFVRVLYVMLLFASLWILWRGQNAPGGGFIGGLMAVAASAAYALVFDAGSALRRLPLEPVRLAACGVLLALLSGLPALLSDLPYLTHRRVTLTFGVVELPVSTVILFDLGIYLCVWGVFGGYCLALVRASEEES